VLLFTCILGAPWETCFAAVIFFSQAEHEVLWGSIRGGVIRGFSFIIIQHIEMMEEYAENRSAPTQAATDPLSLSADLHRVDPPKHSSSSSSPFVSIAWWRRKKEKRNVRGRHSNRQRGSPPRRRSLPGHSSYVHSKQGRGKAHQTGRYSSCACVFSFSPSLSLFLSSACGRRCRRFRGRRKKKTEIKKEED